MEKVSSFLKKNTMLIALIVIVVVLFQVLIMAAGKGSLLKTAKCF